MDTTISAPWAHSEPNAAVINREARSASDFTALFSLPGEVLDSLPDVFWVKDLEGRFLFVNTACASLFGATTDQVIGTRPADWLPRTVVDVVTEHDNTVLLRGEPLEFEESIPKPSGERTFLVRRTVWRNQDGTPQGLVGIGRDITGRHAAETAVMQKQAEAAEATSTDVISRHILGGAVLDISPTCSQLFEYEAGEIIGTHIEEWLHPEDSDHLRTVAESAVRRGTKRIVRFRVRHRKKGYTWVESTLTPIRDEHGRPSRELLCVTHDLAEPMVSQATLQDYANRLRSLTDSVFLGVLIVELDGPVLEANTAALHMLERSAEEIASGKVAWRSLLAPEHLISHDRAVLQLREAAVAPPWETQYIRLDGTRVPVLVGATLMEASLNKCLVYLVDISERKRVEEAQVRSLAEEQSARVLAESAVLRLQGILTVTDTALARLDSNDFLAEILGRICGVLEADSAAVWLVDEDNRHLAVRACHGMEAEFPYPRRVPFGQGAIGKVASTKQVNIVQDLPSVENGNLFLPEQIRSLLAVPLLSNNRIMGVLHIGTTSPRSFSPNEAHLLQLVAERVATAIERARLFDQVRSSQEQLDALSRRLLEVQENERRHIARELHDDIGQTLTAIKIGLLALRSDPTVAAEVIQEALHTVDEAIERVRTLSRHLRPAVLDDLGLVAALSWLVKQQNFGTSQVLLETPDDGRFPPRVETACFRVAQEAINNAQRHAHAGEVKIQLAIRGGNLNLSIMDDGVGFDVDEAMGRNRSGESLGLLNMEERVRLAGGRFLVQSKPGRGTLIRAIFSLKSVTALPDTDELTEEDKGSILE